MAVSKLDSCGDGSDYRRYVPLLCLSLHLNERNRPERRMWGGRCVNEEDIKIYKQTDAMVDMVRSHVLSVKLHDTPRHHDEELTTTNNSFLWRTVFVLFVIFLSEKSAFIFCIYKGTLYYIPTINPSRSSRRSSASQSESDIVLPATCSSERAGTQN